jgi:hypothetical protein
MTKKLYVYRSNRIQAIKDGITAQDLRNNGYFERHPDAVICSGQPPSLETLGRWVSSGEARAIDGCSGIETDGTCEHGCPSWLLAMGYI